MPPRVKLEEDRVEKLHARSSEIVLAHRTGGLYFSRPKDNLQFIKSGSTLLDLALGGGWARRRIVNVVGDKAVGKTLVCIEMSANFAIQEPKGKIRYREAESAFDNDYAEALGFPIERVDFGEPIDTIEDVFEDLEAVLKGAKGPELYIVDSLDSLSDRAELERKIDEGSYGTGKAKMMSQLFRRLIRNLADKDVTVVFVSQVRDNIGVMIGKKTTRSGGRALDFYASQVCFLAQLEKLKRTIKGITRVTGTKVKATIEKNKIALPYREAEFSVLFGHGIDDEASCLDFIKKIGMEIDKNLSLEQLQRVCFDKWWEIEKQFLADVQPKYGDRA